MGSLRWLMLAVVIASAGCAGEPIGDDAFAQMDTANKADGGDTVAFGQYTRWSPDAVGLTRLGLWASDDLPEPWYEGRYSLTERLDDGTDRTSSGAFNTYRYDGEAWIRFLDDATGDYETTFEKYAWRANELGLILRGAGDEEEVELDRPFRGTDVHCYVAEPHDPEVPSELSVRTMNTVSVRAHLDGRIEMHVAERSFSTEEGHDLTFALEGDFDEGDVAVILRHGGTDYGFLGPPDGERDGLLFIDDDGFLRPIATLGCQGTTAPRAIECTLTRRADAPQGPGAVSASVDVHPDGSYVRSELIDAWGGVYGFSLEYDGRRLSAVFDEHEHVFDEIADVGCDPFDVDGDGLSCRDTISVDPNLGVPGADRGERVEAFDFACRPM